MTEQVVQITGDPVATLSRFPGQWYEPETGLHYNRWRYFDPSSGMIGNRFTKPQMMLT